MVVFKVVSMAVSSDTSAKRRTLYTAHGVAMLLVWAVLTVSGVIVARYGRAVGWKHWLAAHSMLQLAGGALTFPLTLLSFFAHDEELQPHYGRSKLAH